MVSCHEIEIFSSIRLNIILINSQCVYFDIALLSLHIYISNRCLSQSDRLCRVAFPSNILLNSLKEYHYSIIA